MTTTGDSLAYGTLRSAVNWANSASTTTRKTVANPAPNTIVFDTSNVVLDRTDHHTVVALGTLDFTNTGYGRGDRRRWLGQTHDQWRPAPSEVLSIADGVTAYLSELTIAHGSATVGRRHPQRGYADDRERNRHRRQRGRRGRWHLQPAEVSQINDAEISDNVARAPAAAGQRPLRYVKQPVGGVGHDHRHHHLRQSGGLRRRYLPRGGSLTLLDTSIANNTAVFDGGGMMNIGGTVNDRRWQSHW